MKKYEQYHPSIHIQYNSARQLKLNSYLNRRHTDKIELIVCNSYLNPNARWWLCKHYFGLFQSIPTSIIIHILKRGPWMNERNSVESEKEIWLRVRKKARNWHRKTTMWWKEMLIQGSGGKMNWMETGQSMRSDCASFSTLFIFNFCCFFFYQHSTIGDVVTNYCLRLKKRLEWSKKKNMHTFVHIDTLKLEDLKMLTGKLPLKKRHTYITTEKPIISLLIGRSKNQIKYTNLELNLRFFTSYTLKLNKQRKKNVWNLKKKDRK